MYEEILLKLSIEEEKAGKAYTCSEEDNELIESLIKDINNFAGTDFHYLMELFYHTIDGVGEIVARYMKLLKSETVKAYLLFQIVHSKLKDKDRIIYDLYVNFKKSDEYTDTKTQPTSAFIFVQYDNAFKKLKPKKLKSELVELAKCPRDVLNLPLTMRMISTWGISEMDKLFLRYFDDASITSDLLGVVVQSEEDERRFQLMKNELLYTAMNVLACYPSEANRQTIKKYTYDSNMNISSAAKKQLRKIEKNMDKKGCFDL